MKKFFTGRRNMIRIVLPVLLLVLISTAADVNAKKSRHHRLQEIHGSNTQVSVTDDGILPLPTAKPGDEYVQESDEDVEDNGGDDDDESDDDDGDESDEEGEESAEVLEKQSKFLTNFAVMSRYRIIRLYTRILNRIRLERTD